MQSDGLGHGLAEVSGHLLLKAVHGARLWVGYSLFVATPHVVGLNSGLRECVLW